MDGAYAAGCLEWTLVFATILLEVTHLHRHPLRMELHSTIQTIVDFVCNCWYSDSLFINVLYASLFVYALLQASVAVEVLSVRPSLWPQFQQGLDVMGW